MELVNLVIVLVTLLIAITPVIIITSVDPYTREPIVSYYKAGEFATISVVGRNGTLKERKWLESVQEGISNLDLEVEKNKVKTSWKQINLEGKILMNGRKVILTSPDSFNNMTIQQITKEEAQELNKKDPVEAPPNPYILQPENLGKFVFISGPPGAGKSSVAAWMAVNAGYVYYEGDGFMFGLNPYTPANASEPSLATHNQHPLVGEGMHQRKMIIDNMNKNFDAAIGDFSKVERTNVDAFLNALADDINNERRRVGGDWIIAYAIPDILSRNILKNLLGDNMVFVIMELSPELQRKRLSDRTPNESEMVDQLASIYKIYEPAGMDELQAIGFNVEEDDGVAENSLKILKLVNEYYQKKE